MSSTTMTAWTTAGDGIDGLAATTLLTFAKGASMAAGGALSSACAPLVVAGALACSCSRAWCSWRPFSMRDMRSL